MSKTTNKGVAWLYNEVCALLDVWADQEIQQQLAGRLHNMCIYEKISQKLADLEIHRTGEQCREKIKKLRRDYKAVVDNNYSPAFARKMLGCYDKVHEVFGKCIVVKPSFVIESMVFNENISRNKKADGSAPETVKDCSISECEQPNNKQRDRTDSLDTNLVNAAQVRLVNSFDITQIDEIGEKKVTTDSTYTIQNDTSDEQTLETDYLDTLNLGIEKGQITFRNACKTMEMKPNEQKTDWNIFKKRIERRLEKQKFLHNKILKRQAVLQKRFIELERKKTIDEMELEHKRLQMLEIERQKHNEQEIKLFKSLLQMMAEKQGVKLSFSI